jgi:hypothetical protein
MFDMMLINTVLPTMAEVFPITELITIDSATAMVMLAVIEEYMDIIIMATVLANIVQETDFDLVDTKVDAN